MALLMALLEMALFLWLASASSSSDTCLTGPPMLGLGPPPPPTRAAAAWLRKRANNSACVGVCVCTYVREGERERVNGNDCCGTSTLANVVKILLSQTSVSKTIIIALLIYTYTCTYLTIFWTPLAPALPCAAISWRKAGFRCGATPIPFIWSMALLRPGGSPPIPGYN